MREDTPVSRGDPFSLSFEVIIRIPSKTGNETANIQNWENVQGSRMDSKRTGQESGDEAEKNKNNKACQIQKMKQAAIQNPRNPLPSSSPILIMPTNHTPDRLRLLQRHMHRVAGIKPAQSVLRLSQHLVVQTAHRRSRRSLRTPTKPSSS